MNGKKISKLMEVGITNVLSRFPQAIDRAKRHAMHGDSWLVSKQKYNVSVDIKSNYKKDKNFEPCVVKINDNLTVSISGPFISTDNEEEDLPVLELHSFINWEADPKDYAKVLLLGLSNTRVYCIKNSDNTISEYMVNKLQYLHSYSALHADLKVIFKSAKSDEIMNDD